MGSYDILVVKCPDCQREVEFQSKAHICTFETYNLDTVPKTVAADLHGEVGLCDCGRRITLIAIVQLISL